MTKPTKQLTVRYGVFRLRSDGTLDTNLFRAVDGYGHNLYGPYDDIRAAVEAIADAGYELTNYTVLPVYRVTD